MTVRSVACVTLISLVAQWMPMQALAAPTLLADRPIGSSGSANVPANVMITASVEFPTAVSQAHLGAFDPGKEYLGYWDPYKCYVYDSARQYFDPVGFTIGVTFAGGRAFKGGSRFCSGRWSGNFLNWAATQTIDTFRRTMSGGERRIDTPTETVLQKALHEGTGGTGNYPIKSLWGSANVANVTPYTWNELHLRVHGLIRGIRVHWNQGTVLNSTLDPGEVEMQAAPRVCKDEIVNGVSLVEENCLRYPAGNYKPIGLIQENAAKMRFGVMGYLNDDSQGRDGGVLRARLKSVGPQVFLPGQAPSSNANAEWDASTGVFIRNPDPADAAATGVSDSGVINYLNKFGMLGTYKWHDPVGELYYSTLRYLRNVGPVPEYSANLTTRMIDGFPVIRSWDDPIQYQCQKNFSVGIGDANSNVDWNLPGGQRTPGGWFEPPTPAAVAADTVMNVHTWTQDVMTYEGLSRSAISDNLGCCKGSWYAAGLAHWAKTRDIRPDLPGMQTVDTYWVDVLEWSVYNHKNFYWLAGKYGGFTDLNGDGKPDSEAEWRSTRNSFVHNGVTYALPDNYFVAANADSMANGLRKAFASIAGKLSRNAGLSFDGGNVTGAGVDGYLPSYNPSSWTGDLRASRVVAGSDGTVSSTPAWSAQAKLEAQAAGTGWSTSRVILTGNGLTTGFQAVPFRAANLSASQLSSLATDPSLAAQLVSYLRGDRSQEGVSLRTRAALLGTIVNGEPVAVTAPNAMYSDGMNPGYSQFKSAYANRPTMVYVGANDGMLHAFNGSTSSTDGGLERWAYLPQSLLTGTPSTSGLANFASTTYSHRYLVDGPIRVQDVDMGRTVGGSSEAGWRTLLVAGLGKGGRSYVGIDVTDPASMVSEAGAASKVLWEFTDPDMGFSYGQASIFKTAHHGWVVAVASGYATPTGNGYIYLLNPRTGALLQKILVAPGTLTDPAGLAHLAAYVPELHDHTADAIYAGDLLGRVWRVDLTSSANPYPVARIATLTASSGGVQPITSAPEVQAAPGGGDRFVFVGTGRLLDETDITLNQQQSLYAIRDGNRWRAALTASGSIPATATRGTMQAVSDLAAGITLNASSSGWYYDLPNGSQGANERSLITPSAFGGQVVFATLTPSADPCSAAGTGRLYALSFNTARTQIPTTSMVVPTNIVRTKIIGTPGRLRVLATTAGIEPGATPPQGCDTDTCQVNLRSGSSSQMRRLNIREIRAQ
jgi:type IV pilus assembly protein PilY1